MERKTKKCTSIHNENLVIETVNLALQPAVALHLETKKGWIDLLPFFTFLFGILGRTSILGVCISIILRGGGFPGAL